MDENLSTVFSNTRGSFINSFRFGVGKTFEDFERYRQLFPFSDAYCNANPMGTKDRFSNYLKTPGEEIDDVLAQFDDLLYCPTERFRSPFRNDLFGSTSEPPNYNFETVRRYGDRSEEHTSELQSQFHLVFHLFFLMTRRPPRSPLFPYTPLFRSVHRSATICSDQPASRQITTLRPCGGMGMGGCSWKRRILTGISTIIFCDGYTRR